MRDRIDEALDGDLPESQLTPGERERLARARQSLAAVSEAFRGTDAPDLTDRVMARLDPARPGSRGVAELARWMWRPRPVAIRPAYAFAATALLLLVPLAMGLPGRSTPATSPAAAAAAAAVASPAPVRVYVQFRFEALGAREVALAGSFTEWAPEIRLVETMPGVWSTLVPLDPGVYDYTYVVDGAEWVPDPGAPQVDDGFGGTNSRLFLTAPAGNV